MIVARVSLPSTTAFAGAFMCAVASTVLCALASGCPAPPATGSEGEGSAAEGEGAAAGEGEGAAAGEGEGAGGEGEGAAAGEGEGEGGGAAPTALSTQPSDGASGVATNQTVSVVWSESIDCTTVVPGTVIAQLDDGTQIALAVTCLLDGATFTVDEQSGAGWPASEHVTIGIEGDGVIASLVGGVTMAAPYLFSFSTAAGADTTPPTVSTTSPPDQATGVATNGSVSVTFDEALACNSVDDTNAFITDAANNAVAAVVTCNGATVTITPSGALAGNTVFTVHIGATITDAAGNATGAASTTTFTTGAGADTTPPAAPLCTTFTTPTQFSSVPISGTKDAAENTDVEASVNGGAFVSIVAIDGLATWSANVTLIIGDNVFDILSKDAAGNASTTTTFTIHRDPNPVNAPVITQIVNSATVASQVIEGTKDAQTAVLLNGNVIVPQDASTTWDALITVPLGSSVLTFTAKDAANNVSDPSIENVTYTDPGAVPAGEVKIDFDVIGNFPGIGDEHVANKVDGSSDDDHYMLSLWVEGPLEDRAGAPERCYFDDTSLQRKYTRHIATVSHSAKTHHEGDCNLANPAFQAGCQGIWTDADARDPDFYAALVESGRWASSTSPLLPNVSRVSAAGHRFLPTDAGQTYWIAQSQPKIGQQPAIDGLTEATVNAFHWAGSTPLLRCAQACTGDQHCVDTDGTFQAPSGGAVACASALPGAFSTCTGARPAPLTAGDDCGSTTQGASSARCNTAVGRCQASGVDVCADGMISVDDGTGHPVCRGESLDQWHAHRTYRWNLSDRSGSRVHAGWYLVWLSVGPDRSEQIFTHIAADLETCWDNAADLHVGTHRAIAAIHVDGTTATTVFADEQGLEGATSCASTFGAGINPASNTKCTCGAGDAWPCPETPNSLGAGAFVHTLNPSFISGAHALSAQYCPTGACP